MITDNKVFKEKIKEISLNVYKATDGLVEYEEFIAIPYFELIVLRFNLNKNTTTLEELDKYESIIYEIVGDEFLVDFMGSVYQRAGVNYPILENKFKELNKQYQNEKCDIVCPFLKEINEDKEALLKLADLPLDIPVWEIQYDEDEIALLLLGKESKAIKELTGENKIFIREAPKEACVGLLKACFYAKRKKISLARLLK